MRRVALNCLLVLVIVCVLVAPSAAAASLPAAGFFERMSGLVRDACSVFFGSEDPEPSAAPEDDPELLEAPNDSQEPEPESGTEQYPGWDPIG